MARTARSAETRQRILDAAGRLFRRSGIDGVGVDAVMKEAGLTHGGFYAHFPSKEALAAEVAQGLLRKAADRWLYIAEGEDKSAALERIVLPYLDADRVTSGLCCPLTTIGNDVARRDSSRQAIGSALNDMIDALARCLPGGRQAALAALSAMVGAVVLARMTDDPALRGALLDAAAASVLPGAITGSALHPAADWQKRDTATH